MADTSPTITWKLVIDSDSSGTGNTEIDLAGTTYNNILNYGAVEAGNYSKVICVRPYVSQTVGNVKFWWQTYKTNVLVGGSSTTLPTGGMCDNTTSSGWTMKYYVSSSYIKLSYFNGDNNSLLTNTNTGGTVTLQDSTQYKRSVWEDSGATGGYYPMQPIPIAITEAGAYPTSLTAMRTRYTDLGWGIATGSGGFGTDCANIGDIAIGGILNTDEFWCNIAQSMDSVNVPSPYIYLAIKPPTDATAGIWSGFAARLSYLWPWT